MKKHFTATAFVIDSKKRTLLLWHKRLNRWMPPGGHIDEDEIPSDAATRECKEETGLDVEIVGDSQKDHFVDNPHEGNNLIKPIAFLLENIPASKERNEPAHQHMDFVYLARPLDETKEPIMLEEESSDIRWFTKDEITELNISTEIYSNVKEYILEVLQ
ncbi:NUDIX domain-containing protein [Candidatus Peregrinibacteria bacterium]|nr:NUDIX domain-containing protein [Candidatus Peregrinibacteria bacterium]MBT3598518.1 NUDIX domain-containing protein [Candidatus Peregrinibacteria bacterium]MBT4366805.1 NUDIX domain-containing protein [Candidatus Peregrinibacteria bacterium]MBT4586086.1 NUDIX domain-containing protein [Candidatus Peregrinibacteria bacterium]MBT6730340.1 NUDIX domain-containing protein [Candidatus Peregrinibacteria bacterium]